MDRVAGSFIASMQKKEWLVGGFPELGGNWRRTRLWPLNNISASESGNEQVSCKRRNPLDSSAMRLFFRTEGSMTDV